MALVLVVGLAAHLATTAVRVARRDGQARARHVHSAIKPDPADVPGWCSSLEPSPFWPSYGRALLGLSWKDWPLGRPLCRAHDGWVEEVCELAHPEIRTSTDPNDLVWGFTKAQKDAYIRLARGQGHDAGYDRRGEVFLHRAPTPGPGPP